MTPEQLTGKTKSHLTQFQLDDATFDVHPAVISDLRALIHAAAHAGLTCRIASGFRSFERQLAIWNRKMSGDVPIYDENKRLIEKSQPDQERVNAILKWSALPGASRHHWGTDFDVFDPSLLPKDTSLLLEPWEYYSGHQAEFYQWLSQHAHQYGFYFPYNKERGGVACEPWHISHHAASTECMQALSVSTLEQQLADSDLQGKSVILKQIEKIYRQYVVNVNR